MHCLY
jgi:hypothetical protein